MRYPAQPTTPQQFADIIIATDPTAFRTISALDAAMCKVNDHYHLGFLTVSIREAARHAVRADARGISPAHELITSRDDPDQDAVRLAWMEFGSRFADGGYAIEVMRAWMADTRKKLLHEAVERRQMPVIVGDAQGCTRFLEPLLEPLNGFCRHLRAATISPMSIMGDDSLGAVPVAVVEIGDGDRLDVLRCLISSPTITLPGARSLIKVPVPDDTRPVPWDAVCVKKDAGGSVVGLSPWRPWAASSQAANVALRYEDWFSTSSARSIGSTIRRCPSLKKILPVETTPKRSIVYP